MSWASEKEEWLATWADARCLGELVFGQGGAGAGASAARASDTAPEDHPDTFFSDVIDAAGRCLVARACGSVVDVFDISPAATAFVSWRVLLPSPVVPSIGLSHACSVHGDAVSLVILTTAGVVHRVQVLNLQEASLPEVRAGSSTAVGLPSAPSAFVALDTEFVAIGCVSGALLALHLQPTGPGSLGRGPLSAYEFSDASMLRRLVGGLMQPAQTPVLALCALSRGAGPFPRLLSFSADGHLRLWEAQERRGHLVASQAVQAHEHSLSLVGTSSAALHVSSLGSRACLALRSSMYLVELPTGAAGAMSLTPLEAPFLHATPTFAAVSRGTLWSIWSGHSRKQLYHLDLEAPDTSRQLRALDASGIDSTDLESVLPGLRALATEGCPRSAGAYRAVFALNQQQEVWKAEEDGFDAISFQETLEAEQQENPIQLADFGPAFDASYDRSAGIEALALSWWVGRVFLPGRYSNAVVAAALENAGAWRLGHGRWGGAGGGAFLARDGLGLDLDLRGAVEEHVRRQAAAPGAGRYVPQHFPAGSALQAACALARAAAEFLRICDAAWRLSHTVCRLSISASWAPHAWYPAGNVKPWAPLNQGAAACPLLLSRGGVSCVRAMHSWSERWWATLHLTRDLSNYEKLDMETVMQMSPLLEWRICATAWFLSQCVGNANMSMALGMLHRGSIASKTLQRFVGNIPSHLRGHLTACVEGIASVSIGGELENIRQVLEASTCSRERRVQVGDSTLDTSRGTWSQRAIDVGKKVCFTDLLRGSIVTSESDYTCASMRDLLLLRICDVVAIPELKWVPLAVSLEANFLLSLALQQSMRLRIANAAQDCLPTRCCDVWAAAFRAPVDGAQRLTCVRVPLASFASVHYAMQLLRLECWEALRWWSRHQPREEIYAYIAAREWVSQGSYQGARKTFEVAEDCAVALGWSILQECLPSGLGSPSVRYNVHVASIFGSRGRPEEEYVFAHKAALAANESDKDLHQQLWSSAFEKAVHLEKWEDAVDALKHVDDFKSGLRLLGQRLRSTGSIEMVMCLTEEHRLFFLSSLHEHASMSPPTAGSDSLACYNLLYALHFRNEEYLKAAVVAHHLYTALDDCLKHFARPSSASQLAALTACPLSGDATSDLRDIPAPRSAVSGDGDAIMEGSGSELFSAFPRVLDHVWPLLEQQRGALLMLTSALSLTPDGMLVAPSPHHALDIPESTPRAASPDLALLRSWFEEAERTAMDTVVTLEDTERRLALVEAQMVMAGRNDLTAPADLAHCVAALGLLGLSLQICSAHGLDAWLFALQPFTRLCLAAERESDEKVGALVDAARGPAQAHMFVRSDGCEALGCGGSMRRGFWQSLEESLLAHTAEGRKSKAPNAETVRLYTLVADEVLASGRAVSEEEGILPRFIVKALAAGPSWVALLRLYMKHRRAEEAVELVCSQLPEPTHSASCSPSSAWSPLRDFPVELVVQLRDWLSQQEGGARGRLACGQLSALENASAKFRTLLAEAC